MSDSDTSEVVYQQPDPAALKASGNAAFAKGNTQQAISMWKEALKAALKLSVRHPSPELHELQMDLRMNISWGFYLEGDYVMAKEHILVVMDGSQEKGPKHYYRMAQIYAALQDVDRALEVVRGALSGPFPDNPGLLQLKNQLEHDKILEQAKLTESIKKNIDLSQIADPRTAEEKTMKEIRPSFRFDPNWTPDTLANNLIEWRHSCCQLMEAESYSDIDDWANSKIWITPYTQARLEPDKTALYTSLPLSICLALENSLRDPLPLKERQSLSSVDMSRSIQLPQLPKSTDKNEIMVASVAAANTPISRHFRAALSDRVFTIHVVGSRGDREMECKWSAILERLPYVEILHVILIGFIDQDDPYCSRLDRGVLAPPLTKKSAHRSYQKFVARIFKGTYQEFLHSENTIQSNTIQPKTGIDINGFQISPILSNPTHEFYPNLVVMPEPNFPMHLQSWTPALAEIILARIPLLVTGYSVLEGDVVSHDGLTLKPILDHFQPKFVVPLYLNPFSLPVDPGPDCIAMILENGTEFSGISAKHAVATMVFGIDPQGPKTAEEARILLAKLASDPQFVEMWLQPVISKYGLTQDDRSLLKFVSETRETIVQEKTSDLTKQLDRLLSKKSKTNEMTQSKTDG